MAQPVAEMSVSRENGERNRVLMQWFSVWTMVPASRSVPAHGHNLLFSKVSHGVLRDRIGIAGRKIFIKNVINSMGR